MTYFSFITISEVLPSFDRFIEGVALSSPCFYV